ncbi:MAG: DUF2029 domain-containing protein [Myxococcales bacterium]|nr:DUF2029 domain-containing protein [Myxococcales bacterium]
MSGCFVIDVRCGAARPRPTICRPAGLRSRSLFARGGLAKRRPSRHDAPARPRAARLAMRPDRECVTHLAQPPATIAVVAITLGTCLLHWTRGRYAPWAVLASVAVAGVLIGAGCWRRHGPRSAGAGAHMDLPCVWLLGAAAVATGLLAALPRWVYTEKFRTESAVQAAHAIAAVGFLVAAWRVQRNPMRGTTALIAAIAAGLVGVRLLVPWMSPNPFIDSWTLQQEAGDVLLAGGNPYGHAYAQLYPFERFGYLSHFGYLPVIAYFDAVGRWLVRDVRWLYVACDVATAWGFGRLAAGTSTPWRWGPRPWALAAWFLALPYGPFVVEQCWSEPLLLALATWSVVAWQASPRGGGVALGVLLVAKQTNGLLAVLALAGPGSRDRGRRIAWTVAAAAGISAPLALADPEAFLRSTVFGFAQMPPRTDGFSLWTVAFVECGWEGPAWASAVLALPLLALATARSWRQQPAAALGALAATYHVFFLGARQSFGNYHWFALGLWALTLAARAAAPPGADSAAAPRAHRPVGELPLRSAAPLLALPGRAPMRNSTARQLWSIAGVGALLCLPAAAAALVTAPPRAWRHGAFIVPHEDLDLAASDLQASALANPNSSYPSATVGPYTWPLDTAGVLTVAANGQPAYPIGFYNGPWSPDGNASQGHAILAKSEVAATPAKLRWNFSPAIHASRLRAILMGVNVFVGQEGKKLGVVRIHRDGKPDLERVLLIGTDVRNFKQVPGTNPTWLTAPAAGAPGLWSGTCAAPADCDDANKALATATVPATAPASRSSRAGIATTPTRWLSPAARKGLALA